MPNDLLMIAWSYPPFNATGSKRAGCFAKYLPNYGWQPVVVCPKWTPDNCIYDAKFVTNIPDAVEVERVPYERPGAAGPFAWLKTKVRNQFFPHIQPEDYFHRAKRAIAGLFERHSFSVIWATSPMAMPHVLASWASARWGVPWVADFRDVYGQFKTECIGDRLKLPVRLMYERRFLRNAAEIVTVSEALAEILTGRHGRKVHVIANGYDPDEAAPVQRSEGAKPLRFNITYTGTVVLPQRNPRPVLDALGRLVEAGKVEEQDVDLDLYGVDVRTVSRLLRRHRYYHLVKARGRVSAAECLEVQRSAAVLLQLAHGGEKGILTGKIYEYLAAGRPIISVPSDADGVDRLLLETNAGVSCTTVSEIAAQLHAWYREWKETGDIAQDVDRDAVSRYSRKEQAKQLAGILDRVCAAKAE